jgi:hypothetical protein
MNGAGGLMFNNINSMQQEFVPSKSSVASQTSMPMNNPYAPIDSIDSGNYFEISYASKRGHILHLSTSS